MRFAVVMNRKARKVRQSTIDMVAAHVPADDLYITNTIEQCDGCIREIVEQRYELVFCGGGDGTAMRIIEQMRHHLADLNKDGGDYAHPKIGILHLGTGNGWAGYLQTPHGAGPIQHVNDGKPLKFTSFDMVRSGDRLTHFAGIGTDGAILNDYMSIKNRFQSGLMWTLVNGLWGYIYTIAFISAPSLIRNGADWPMRVINDSDKPVLRVDEKGELVPTDLAKGDVLFEGKANFAGVSTTPDYGFHVRMYPWSMEREGYFQLRISAISIPGLLIRPHQVWRGTIHHPKLHDYLLDGVRVESDVELPFQMGGDPEGWRKDVSFAIAEPVEVLDFRE